MSTSTEPVSSNIEKAILTVLYSEKLLRAIVHLMQDNNEARAEILAILQVADPTITLDAAELKEFQNLLKNGHVKITVTELLNYYDCLESNAPPPTLKKKGPPSPQVWVI